MKNLRYTLITGASMGIGYELAKLFAKDKRNLILISRNILKLQDEKNELSTAVHFSNNLRVPKWVRPWLHSIKQRN